VFMWGASAAPSAYSYSGSAFSTTPLTGSVVSSGNEPPVAMAETWNSAHLSGSEILWATNYDSDGSGNAYLFAFNANNLSTLWQSSSAADSIGSLALWVPPTVVNGKVYVASDSNSLSVYGNPAVFWGQNSGYQFNPMPSDWANGFYKGECEQGEAVTGLSAVPSGVRQAHGVLCSGWVPTNTGCQVQGFNSTLPGNPAWDWDVNYLKAECPANFYVEGVSQSTAGVLNSILCCPTAGATLAMSASTCGGAAQNFYGQNSSGYGGPDWDNGYYKGQCPAGQVVAGVSEVTKQSPVGAPHAILCCQR
jgi:hypothetical protein